MAEEKVDVTIRLDPDATPERVEDIVRALTAGGLERPEVHARFRIVNGTVDIQSVDALGAVDGVASVRRDRTYRAQDD